ncbi:thiopeptide-type bacteriocin biosynthesis protein [Actinocrispum wychmicini]|uniref:Thiopeptide-type bacteriocin biosynthesis protein n=1 Tax=Actinocrispum wychmicini TaxID=1213861 RepID=A0A4R2JEG8_9PSEU|nr:thiopeptide-type bacteriocin biosynthesis protein [Actinocrispum wychmicini]TCO56582.1 thiopeptide-type bacteriocin biosynthesis protein [Actinocrispum wychmicini]
MTWTSLHCRLSWQPEHVDEFIVAQLVPLLRDHEWFFVRYWETGPHLRIRIRGEVDVAARLRDLIAAQDYPVQEIDPEKFYASIGAASTAWLPHGDVREVPYEPETERYGGRSAVPAAENLFCRSTEVAIAVLKSTSSVSARLTAAMQLAMATTQALGLSRAEAASWLRLMGNSWRFTQEPAAPPTVESHVAAHQVLERHGKELAARWDQEPSGATAYWLAEVRASKVTMARVVASQLHMLFNRIGVGSDQERIVCWVVAATALADGVAEFHGDDLDLKYMEASKFLPGFHSQHPLHKPRHNGPRQPGIPLPEPQVLLNRLVKVLVARETGRGAQLAGHLYTKDLSTLLWTAQGAIGFRRPYPSAGAKYAARIRVIALNIPGLYPGCYDADEESRTLQWAAPCPSVEDLETTSMWLGPETTPLAETPAVLALYVRLGVLRETYGLRGLRFAFMEAGHLAQNLGLVAAAMGLNLGLIGGIYDDLAHDLLNLDGVNDTLAYLMPVARLAAYDNQQQGPRTF